MALNGSGSLINGLASGWAPAGSLPLPRLGDGATVFHWTDRSAWTVVQIISARGRDLITIQRDRAVRVDQNGMSECQAYRFERDPAGETRTVRLKTRRLWQSEARRSVAGAACRWVVDGGSAVQFGVRDEYRDFSF